MFEANANRSAFLVGAGVVVVLGGLTLAFRLFNTSDAPPPVPPAAVIEAPAPADFPPEVVKLIADTEIALQHDDLKAARIDIAALQQIAPTHPQLPFFESLLEKEDALASRAPLASGRSNSRHRRKPAPAPASPARSFGGKTLEEDAR